MNPQPKASRIRVNRNTKAWAELDRIVRERDNGRCVACSRSVPSHVPLHHEPPKKMGGGDGEDIPEKMCVLCTMCHHERHFGKRSQAVKAAIIEYLKEHYGRTGI